MDDAVTVILPGTILQSRLYGHDGLIEGRVADRVHLDLKPFAIGLFRKMNNLFIGVEEDSAILGIVRIRLPQRCILAAEAAVQGRCKASPHPGKLSLPYLGQIHGLEEDPGLKTGIEPLPQDHLHSDIQIKGETYAGYGMHHSEPFFRHVIDGPEHVSDGP